MKFEIGDEVFWKDPDEDVCSGYGVVTDKHGRRGEHRIYVLKMQNGGELECFQHELN